jgi:hypothetical protein
MCLFHCRALLDGLGASLIFAKATNQFSTHHPFAPQNGRVGATVDAFFDGGSQDVGEVVGSDRFGLARLAMEGPTIGGFWGCRRQAVGGDLLRSYG